MVETEVVVWRPPAYVLPVDTEPPEHYCGSPAERAAWIENSRLRAALERAEGARLVAGDARDADRAGWRARHEINLLAVEQEVVAAEADVEAVAQAAQRDLDDTAAAAHRAWELAGLDHEDAIAAARHRGEVADLGRRTALYVAETVAERLRAVSPPEVVVGGDPGGESAETPPETGGESEANPQVSGGDPDPWLLGADAQKLDEARAFYLHQRRAGETPSLARINKHIGSKKYVVRDHVEAWEAELAQERRFRAVGG